VPTGPQSTHRPHSRAAQVDAGRAPAQDPATWPQRIIEVRYGMGGGGGEHPTRLINPGWAKVTSAISITDVGLSELDDPAFN
jgi:hypothetical protein